MSLAKDIMDAHVRGLHETQDDTSGHMDCDHCGFCVTCRDCAVYGCGADSVPERLESSDG